jgi:hypothetical protein
VVAENGFVAVHVASWGMAEAAVEGEVEGYGLEADVCVIVLLSDSSNYIIVKLLELDSLSQAGKQKSRVSDRITNKRLIDKLISNDIRVTLESLSKFLPILHKLFVEMGSGVVQMIEDIPNIVAEVVIPPIGLVAFVPIRLS